MNNKFYTRFPLLGLLISQFFGAFNDNAWKLIVFTLATRPLLESSDFDLSSQTIATLSMLVFLLPMMIFSLPAGILADRYSKRNVMIGAKCFEVILMALATASLFLFPHQMAFPFTLLGLMGLQSAIFGPSKYGILLDILPKQKLSKGNGLLEMWTMIAIIAGTGLGPILLAADHFGTRPEWTWIGGAFLTLFAGIGCAAAFAVPRVRAAKTTSSSSWQDLRTAFSSILSDKVLSLAFLGSVFYWSIISLLGQNVLVYAKSLVIGLEKGEIWQGIPPAAYGLGITLGALMASRISRSGIELGLIPLGAIGFSLSSVVLGLLHPDMFGTVVILLLMGMSSGLVIVPLNALIQSRAKPEQRGAVIAIGNFSDIAGMLGGSLFAMGMAWIGVGIEEMLFLSALFVIVGTVWAIKILPAALVRLCFILLTRTLYRLKVRGIENIPASGPFLLISNHISCIDALFVMASVNRPVYFIMNESYYNRWWLNPLARLLGTIPVSSSSNPRLLVEGIRRVGDYLNNGEVVCLFPEGQVTHTGVLLPFQRGVEVIMRDHSCPIVPMYIDGVWGSIFSFKGGRFFKKWPEYRPCSLTVTFGKPLPSTTEAMHLRQAIQELEYEAWMGRKEQYKPMPHLFVQRVRQHPWASALCDKTTPKMSRLKVLTGAIVLGRLLNKIWKDDDTIAILLPTSIPAVLCNIAAALAGRPVVNLNFTAGAQAIASAIQQANIKTIITSRTFLEKAPVPLPEGVRCIYLEDIRSQATGWLKFTSLLMALIYDVEEIQSVCGAKRPSQMDDVLTIIFTSGSSGEPKGVMLSHFNVHANSDGVAQVVVGVPKYHRLFHSLPFFHSFGYMLLWLGLNYKHTLILHPNPLDFGVVGELVHRYKASLMLTTPTFLRGYMKRALPGQFGSLRCVLTGAEKLPDALAHAFDMQFGIRPIEGYGATECSPVIATSTVDVREHGIYQVGTRLGYVGKPLPGVLVRVVHPETREDLPCDEPGLLLVKGPNVMQGYLNKPELTQQVIVDGWYVTGDIAQLDSGGFVKITDRLSRFSKIGGEMVPHGKVEELLQQVMPSEDPRFVVTAVPDSQKGEALVVVHSVDPNKIAGILNELTALGIPNLYIPKPDHFIYTESLPLLGSGKLDLQTIKKMAREKMDSLQH